MKRTRKGDQSDLKVSHTCLVSIVSPGYCLNPEQIVAAEPEYRRVERLCKQART